MKLQLDSAFLHLNLMFMRVFVTTATLQLRRGKEFPGGGGMPLPKVLQILRTPPVMYKSIIITAGVIPSVFHDTAAKETGVPLQLRCPVFEIIFGLFIFPWSDIEVIKIPVHISFSFMKITSRINLTACRASRWLPIWLN